MIIGDQTVNAGLDEGIMWLMATGHDMDSERKSKEAQAQRNAGVATEPN